MENSSTKFVLRMGKQSQWQTSGLEKCLRFGRKHNRSVVTGIDVRQFSRISAEHDEHGRGKAIHRAVSNQVLVNLSGQCKRTAVTAGDTPNQSLNICCEQSRCHPLSGYIG